MQPGPPTSSPPAATARPGSVPPGQSQSLFATAPVTCVIIAVNVAVFIAQVVAGGGNLHALWSVPQDVMRAFGGNYAASTIREHHFEALVTSCFLHFSALHLGFNMYALKQAGPLVERSVGPGRFAPMYVAAGALGSLLSALVGVLTHTLTLSAGASGAICGVIGAAMVLGARTQGWRGPLTRSMAQWLGMIVLMGFLLPGIDFYAHAGGAIAGALIAASWRRGVVYGAVGRWIGILAASGICLSSAAIVLARDVSDPYALLGADARYQQAIEALSAGHCDEARRALAAAAKLAPTAPQVIDLRRAIDARCEE